MMIWSNIFLNENSSPEEVWKYKEGSMDIVKYREFVDENHYQIRLLEQEYGIFSGEVLEGILSLK